MESRKRKRLLPDNFSDLLLKELDEIDQEQEQKEAEKRRKDEPEPAA